MSCNKELLGSACRNVRPRLVRRMGYDLADDVLHTACMRLLEQPEPVPDDVLPMQLEALALVIGTQARRQRRREYHKLHRLPPLETTSDGEIAQTNLAHDVRKALLSLPPRMAAIAWRVWGLGQTYRQVHAALGVSHATIMRDLETAQRRLQLMLSDYAPGQRLQAVRLKALHWMNRRTRP